MESGIRLPHSKERTPCADRPAHGVCGLRWSGFASRRKRSTTPERNSMRTTRQIALAVLLISWSCSGQHGIKQAMAAEAGVVTRHSRGLHGYIGYRATRPPSHAEYSAGMGFYAAVWPLIDQPIANFQIGLPSAWITPDNSDNKDKPLAPEGTLARKWTPRGPTLAQRFSDRGGWAGLLGAQSLPLRAAEVQHECHAAVLRLRGRFPGLVVLSTATRHCRITDLGIAQLSNRLLIPPDALPFEGNPNGEFLGYTYMALPFTDPTTGDPPTGDQAWTCFLSAANFKGPIAYYIPETWSKIGKLFNYPFIYGRGLDARPGNMGGGAMEINTVPRFDGRDAQGVVYSKIPKLQFPVDEQGRSLLVQDVTYYSKGRAVRRIQGLAGRRTRLLRTIRRAGGLEGQVEHPVDAVRPGRQ